MLKWNQPITFSKPAPFTAARRVSRNSPGNLSFVNSPTVLPFTHTQSWSKRETVKSLSFDHTHKKRFSSSSSAFDWLHSQILNIWLSDLYIGNQAINETFHKHDQVENCQYQSFYLFAFLYGFHQFFKIGFVLVSLHTEKQWSCIQ